MKDNTEESESEKAIFRDSLKESSCFQSKPLKGNRKKARFYSQCYGAIATLVRDAAAKSAILIPNQS